MKSKINQLLSDIKIKKEELKEDFIIEYEKLKEKYGFTVKGKKIIFNSETRKINKKYKKGILKTIFNARIREILSIPFIYSMFIPVIILDIFLFIYQTFAFRLYNIPLVKRSDYIIYDRKILDYLNLIQKFNCNYCSYVNGFLSYAVEVAGRTERYWCPIKNSKKMKGGHEWQEYFADYGDANGFKSTFYDIQKEKNFKENT